MGGLFSKPKVSTPTPMAPSAPVEEATFKPGGEEDTDSKVKKRKAGKKRLQIPTGTASTSTGGTGLSTGV